MIINASMPPARKPVALFFLAMTSVAFAPSVFASDKPRPAPPVKPAAEYVLNDPHPQEHVTVAAEPCTEPANCAFFRLEYLQHGFQPVRVIITNDRDEALILDDVRIQFFPAEGERLPAATDEDLNRRLFSKRYAEGTKIPIIGITLHKEPIDKKIVNDNDDFGFQSTTIPPHSTRAGYVFYDTRQLDDPILRHAELGIKMMHYVDAKAVRHEIFAFQLPFDKWLAAQPKPAPAAKPTDSKADGKPDS